MIIDLDANATYAPTEEIQGVIGRAWHRLGNPSSLHRGGQRARAEIEKARESVRRLVGAAKDDLVVFTSGATEANNTVLSGGWRSVVVSAVEHPCVLGPARRIQASGGNARIILPNSAGEIESTALLQALLPESELVSVMTANNETGVQNDIRALSTAARQANPRVLFHSDAAQALGKQPISFSSMGTDLLTVSGHKIGALTGVGALIIKNGVSIPPLLLGGSQEHKLRGGTENVLGVVSFGEVAQLVQETLISRIDAMRRLRNGFEDCLTRAVPGCEFNGHLAGRLPNTSSVYIPGAVGDDLVVALDLEGILVSSGAACSSGKPEPSHVLLAMGQDEERVRSTIRVSFRADQSVEIVPRVVDAIARVVSRMRLEGASR
jgi:cysteine desulfurase